jgi:hypothetical protein
MPALGFVVHLLTFNCYGTHLRGAELGSIDRVREGRGGPIEPSVGLVNYAKRTMTRAEASLDLGESLVVLGAISETCAIRDFKAYASRALNGKGAVRRWARGGNVRTLDDSRSVRAAVRYVVDCPGSADGCVHRPGLVNAGGVVWME